MRIGDERRKRNCKLSANIGKYFDELSIIYYGMNFIAYFLFKFHPTPDYEKSIIKFKNRNIESTSDKKLSEWTII